MTFSFTLLLLLGTGSLLIAHSLFIQPLTGAVIAVPFLFIFIGVSRFLWALRLRLQCGLREAAAAFTVLLALTWVVTLACALGLVKERGVFLRTPKRRTATDRWHAYRVSSQESLLAGLCFASAAALGVRIPYAPYSWLMVGLLVWQGVIYSSATRVSLWSRTSEARLAHPEYLASSRTTGRRFSSMVTDRRVVRALWAGAGLAAVLFFLAVRLAPEEERAFRTNPHRQPLIAGELTRESPEAEVRAIIYLEARAARGGDVDAALRLWSPRGVVRDARYTPGDTGDDRVWAGLDAIRERYREEFRERRYLELSHMNISTVIEGNRAVVVNDLRAVIRTKNGVQRVFLARGDRWTFERDDTGWHIVELIFNRVLE